MTEIVHIEDGGAWSQLSDSSQLSENRPHSTPTSTTDVDIEPIKETGSRACLVVASLFILGFIETGIIKSFGVLVDDLVLQFESDIGTVGFVIGLSNGISYILAPFTAPLSNRKTIVRPMMLLGSVIMGLAISMSSLSSSIVGLATAMAISGVGYAMVLLPSVVIFNRYFTKHFALALGITEVGSSLSLLFPLMTETMLEATGLRGTILLLGGISLNTVVCSALLRDPRTLVGMRTTPNKKIIDKARTSSLDSDRNEDSMSCSTSHDKPKQECVVESTCQQERSSLILQDTNSHANGREYEVEMIPLNNTGTNMKVNQHRKKEALGYNPDSPKRPKSEHKLARVLLSPFRWLWSFLDLSLCRDEPYLNFIYLATFLFTMVHTAWYIYFVPHALAKGLTLSNAVHIYLIAGVGEGIGAFLQGPIVDRGWMTSLGLLMMMSLFNSIIFFLDPLLSNMMLLGAAGFVNGFFLGGSLTLTSIILKDTVSPSRFATSYGLSSLTYGLAAPLGGFTAGWIASLLGHEMAFVFMGGLCIMVLLALIPAYCHFDYKCINKHSDCRETPI